MESIRELSREEKADERRHGMEWILSCIRDWMSRATPREKYNLKRKLRALSK